MYTPTLILTTTAIFGLSVLIIVTTVFVLAMIRRDNSIMDIAYGPTFFLAGVMSILFTESRSLLTLLMLGLIALWSLRLCLRIYRKNRGQPEDARYAAWRTSWSERGHLYFVLRSYLQINVLQGIIITLVASPFILSLVETSPETLHYPLLAITVPLGLLVFAVGLAIETTADWQLDRFIARKRAGTETAPIIESGLFRYSRRPNYFGETLIWWGLALMVLPLPYGYLALMSPLIITYIVTRITGPMLEKIFREKYPVEYAAYEAKTSYFFPLPPKQH